MSDINNLPAEWLESADVLSGLELEYKPNLIGIPLLVIGCRFELSSVTSAQLCYIDAQTLDGRKVTFQDSSTGVKEQIKTYLNTKGLDAGIETGEYIPFKLIAPKGLRVSKYDRPIKTPAGIATGKTQPAETYYLSTNGQVDSPAPARKPRGARNASS